MWASTPPGSPASTAAYAAVERGRVASPRDLPLGLPMPDLTFLLHVPEETRLQRIHRRDTRLTDEEQRLERDDVFRRRVLEGYAALDAVRVEATGTPQEIAARIVRRVREA